MRWFSILLLFALACSGSSDSAHPIHFVETSNGAARVHDGCGGVDLEQIREEIIDSYRLGEEQNARVGWLALDGTTIRMTNDLPPRYSGYHNYRRNGVSIIWAQCGEEKVVGHEMLHRFAHQLGLPCDRAMVGHSGGYDLNCQEW